MTNEQHEAPEPPPRRRKRKGKGKAPKRRPLEVAPARQAPPAPSSARARALGGALAAVALAYVATALGPDLQAHLLVAVGVLGFVFGSASGIDPRKGGLGAGASVAIGLAVVATSTARGGPALVMTGGLGLAGGIHRLGRLGPDEEGTPEAEGRA